MSRRYILILALLLPALALLLPGAARAAGAITVSTTDDVVDGDTGGLSALAASPGADGKISLREALLAADNTTSSAAAPNVITLPAGVYSLGAVDTGELRLGSATNRATQIVGAGALVTIIRQTAANRRVFDLDPGVVGGVAVRIAGVTITGGTGTTFGGGGILAGGSGDSLALDAVTISGNTTANGNQGGGIAWGGGGDLTITNSAIVGNSSDLVGGGIAFNQTGNLGNLTISRTTIADNTVSNPSGGQGGGLVITGHNTATLTNVDISNNQIVGGAAASQQGGAIDIQGGTLRISLSRIVGNVAGSGSAIYTAGGASTTANDNWWGCNGGPGAPCGSFGNTNDGIGALTLTRWLQARAGVSPASISAGGAATVSADILGLSDGGTAAAGDLAGLPAFPYAPATIFSGATGGSLSNVAGQLTGGQAGATFTAAGCAPGSVGVTVDGAQLSAAVGVQCASTTTTITSDSPDPSTVGEPVSVRFSVTSGAGAPAGEVTVTDGVDSCSASVADGQCALTLTTAGARTLTASYAGGGGFTASTSAGEPHSVSQAPPPTSPATITIALDAQPDSRTNIHFTGDLGRFTLDDISPQDGDAFSNSKTFSVPAGTYTITEQLSPLWSNPDIACDQPQATIVDLTRHQLTIRAAAGAAISCTFITQRNGEIVAGAYDDRNANGRYDRHDAWLAGWQMQVTSARTLAVMTAATDAEGRARFTHLPPGDYQVCAIVPAGWQNVTPGGAAPCYQVTVAPRKAVWARFGNRRAP